MNSVYVLRCEASFQLLDQAGYASMKQSNFSDMAYDQKKKKTRKERFLGEMDAVLPWDLLLAPILEHYPKAGGGRRPIGALVMLRIYFMQQ